MSIIQSNEEFGYIRQTIYRLFALQNDKCVASYFFIIGLIQHPHLD